MAPKKKRTYQIKSLPENDQVIAVPMTKEKNTTPRVILTTDEERKTLRLYMSAKRAVARHEPAVKDLVEAHGKLSYKGGTISPAFAKTYEYDDELQAEIDAVDEKKKAARVDGEVLVTEGRMSLRFADKKKKPAKLTAGKAGK